MATLRTTGITLSTPGTFAVNGLTVNNGGSITNLPITNSVRYANGIVIGDSTSSAGTTGITVGKNSVSGASSTVIATTVVPLSGPIDHVDTQGPQYISVNITNTSILGIVRIYNAYDQLAGFLPPLLQNSAPFSVYRGILTGQSLTGLTLLATKTISLTSGTANDVDFSSFNILLTPGYYTFGMPVTVPSVIWQAQSGSFPATPAWSYGTFGIRVMLMDVYSAITNNTIVIGNSSIASASNSVVVGSSASSSVPNGLALGQGATVSSASNALAIAVNSSSVLPGNFGINVNGSTYQLPLYPKLYDATTTVSNAITTLTNRSAHDQYFSGTASQNVSLPDVTTLNNTGNVSGGGYQYTIRNGSSGTLTIGNGITILDSPTTVLPAGSYSLFVRSVAGFPPSGSFNIQTVANGMQTITYTSIASFSGATYQFNHNLPTSVITFQNTPSGLQGQGYVAFPTVANGIQIVGYTFKNGTAIFNCTGGTGTIAAGTVGTQAVFLGCTGGAGTTVAQGTTLGRFITTVQPGASQDLVLVSQTGVPTTDWYVPSYPSTSGVTSFQTSLSGLSPSTGAVGNVTLSGTLGAASGGTGLNTSTATNGQLLIGNGSGFTLAPLTAGSNVTITNSAGGITIAATGGGGAVSSVLGTTNQITTSPTTGNVVVSLPDQINFGVPYVSIGAQGLAGIGGVCIGKDAAPSLVSTQNIVIGGSSGTIMSSATKNVIIGDTCATSFNGNGIVCIGQGALNGVTTSITQSTFVGSNAAASLTSGTQNAFVGYWDSSSMTTGDSNAFLGYNTGNFLASSSENTFIGAEAAQLYTSIGSRHTFIGARAGGTFTSLPGQYVTCIGADSRPSGTGANSELTLGDPLLGLLRCAVALSVTSDGRDKTDIIGLDAGITFADALKPVRFTWNHRDGGHNRPDVGFIAQDLQQVQLDTGIKIPGLVIESNPEHLEVTYDKLIPVLVKAVQELSARDAASKALIATLTEQNLALNEKMQLVLAKLGL